MILCKECKMNSGHWCKAGQWKLVFMFTWIVFMCAGLSWLNLRKQLDSCSVSDDWHMLFSQCDNNYKRLWHRKAKHGTGTVWVLAETGGTNVVAVFGLFLLLLLSSHSNRHSCTVVPFMGIKD